MSLPLRGDNDVARRARQSILAALRELADERWQSTVWEGGGDGHAQSSFVEAVCALYGDSTLGNALDTQKIVFDEDTDGLLRHLRGIVEAIDPYLTPSALRSLPEWPDVMRTADAAIRRLSAIV